LHETRICFVCSHFAADLDKTAKRNSDYRSTRQRLKFEYNANLDYYDLDAHDIIFWFGDLNYRIDTFSLMNALELIFTNELDKLLVNDQLLKEKTNLNVFEDYNEGKINFRPTYKYLVRQDTYAKHELVKNSQTPNELTCDRIGYTDRILWKQNSQDLNVNLTQYSAINTITLSDHKPVYAVFETEIKRIDIEKYDQKYNEWLKENDRRQNDEMPHITSSHLDYKFNNVLFYDRKHFSFTVTNTGLRLTNVDILFHGEDKWLTINPHSKEKLAPNSNYKIELKTNLSHSNLKRLNNIKPTSENFLVISCLNGNHLFFTASMEYKRTIIGYSIQSLSHSLISQSFYESLDQVISIEKEIEKFETSLDKIWLDSLKSISAENEILKLKAMAIKNEPIRDFLIHTKIDIYKNCLILLKNEIVTQDKYFGNELLTELTYFMQAIIDNEEDKTQSFNFESIEDQKNEILDKLSSKNNIDQFKKYDHEVLIQVLNDLLLSLPNLIIPDRYFDYIMYAGNNYQDMLFLLDYIPRSNLKLFQLIIKFLKIKNSQEITSIISNALFKIDYDFSKEYNPISNKDVLTDINLHRRKIVLNFINIFIQNY
jgi:hypothetical protein